MRDGLTGLPDGWLSISLREIAEIVGGVTKDAKKSLGPGGREVPYLRVANVQRGRLDLAELKTISATEAEIQKLSLQPGDILLNEGGDRDKLGRGWIWQGQIPECIHQNHVFRARLRSHDIDPLYVAHFTNSIAQSYFADHGSQTTNLASISLTKLGSLPIRLPPSQEQRRIVTKLEELLSDLDAGVAELKAAHRKLAQYRQSLLKAAVEGTLTAAWRAARADSGAATETGAQLLARILQERRARWEARQRERFAAQGKAPPKDWQKKYPEPAAPDTAGLPELPQGWAWASVDQLCHSVRNGISSTPNTDGVGYPILKINAVRPMSVRFDAVKHIDLSAESAAEYFIEAGDLLATRYNGSVDLLGVIGLVRGDPGELLHPDKLIRLKPAISGSLGPWIELAANVGASRTHVVKRVKTTAGQTGISGEDIKKMPIPLPPDVEQAAALLIADSDLGAITRLQAAVDVGFRQSTAQRQNILRAAFSGQLVPQDPADEPASAMLARIRAERSRPPATQPRHGRAARRRVPGAT